MERAALSPVLRRCGWGVAILDFTDVFAPSLVFARGGGLPGAKQNCPQIRGLRRDPGAPRRAAGGRTLWGRAAIYDTSGGWPLNALRRSLS